MKDRNRLWIAGMIAGFILMVVIGYTGLGGTSVLAGEAQQVDSASPEGYNGPSACPGNCAVCGLCMSRVVLDEEIEVFPVAESQQSETLPAVDR